MNRIRGKTAVVERTAVGMLFVLLLDGCMGVGVEETILPARIDYTCAGSRLLPVARSADGRAAAVLVDGQKVVLQRMASAAQEKYGDGRYLLYLEESVRCWSRTARCCSARALRQARYPRRRDLDDREMLPPLNP